MQKQVVIPIDDNGSNFKISITGIEEVQKKLSHLSSGEDIDKAMLYSLNYAAKPFMQDEKNTAPVYGKRQSNPILNAYHISNHIVKKRTKRSRQENFEELIVGIDVGRTKIPYEDTPQNRIKGRVGKNKTTEIGLYSSVVEFGSTKGKTHHAAEHFFGNTAEMDFGNIVDDFFIMFNQQLDNVLEGRGIKLTGEDLE